MQKSLIFLEYLDAGIIPVAGFDPENIQEFEKFLSSLSPQEQRVLKRKFRKIFRKIVKKNLSSKSPPSKAWIIHYGVGETQPTKRQLKARRRLVHQEILKAVNKRINNA